MRMMSYSGNSSARSIGYSGAFLISNGVHKSHTLQMQPANQFQRHNTHPESSTSTKVEATLDILQRSKMQLSIYTQQVYVVQQIEPGLFCFIIRQIITSFPIRMLKLTCRNFSKCLKHREGFYPSLYERIVSHFRTYMR